MTIRFPASPNRFLPHDGVDGFQGIGGAIADGNAFSLGEAGGFDDEGFVADFDVLVGLIGVDEDAHLGSGDGLMAHNFLGEPLIGFDLGAGFVWPEDDHAHVAQPVGEAEGEGIFRADDDEIDGVVADEFFDGREIGDGDGEAVCEFGDAGVSGDAK